MKTLKLAYLLKIKYSGEVKWIFGSKHAENIVFTTENTRRLTIMNGSAKTESLRIDITEHEDCWTAVTPDLKWGISAGIHNHITIWDLRNRATFKIDNGHHNYCGFITDDGTKLLFGGEHTWDLWDFQTKKMLTQVRLNGHVYTMAITSNCERVLTGNSDGTIWLWDVASAKSLTSFKAHNGAVYNVAMSQDNKSVMSQDFNGEICLWRYDE
jgi:WD40 repeat protein